MKKILVTGVNGLVGNRLVNRLVAQNNFNIVALARGKCRLSLKEEFQYIDLDLTKHEQLKEAIRKEAPDAIIHTAALSQVNHCEDNPECCRAVNVDATRNLVQVANEIGAYFCYISTDFVFDGLKEDYTEFDQLNPVSTYGKSKADAEKIVLTEATKASVVRTALVYGVVESMSRSNIVLWVRKSLMNGSPIRVVCDQYRVPTFVDDLVGGILHLVEKSETGIYHLTGPEFISVIEFSRLIARYFNLDESLISPVTSFELGEAGTRPPSTNLLIAKAKKQWGYSPLKLNEGLKEFEDQLQKIKFLEQ